MGLLLLGIVMAVIVAIIASSKGRSGGVWFLYGFVLWPVALVHILVSSPTTAAQDRKMREQNRAPCLYCAEYIPKAAKLCPQCRSELPEGWAKPKQRESKSVSSQPKPAPKREPSLEKPKRPDDRFMDHRGK